MGEISKAVGQWIVANVGWSIIILLFVLSCFFKIAKTEIDPFGWLVGLIGKALTKDVRNDIKNLKETTDQKFKDIQEDRLKNVNDLKQDYDQKISDLREDLDDFELKAKNSIAQVREEAVVNCENVSLRLSQMVESNDMQTVRQIKAHVLEFANSCLNKNKHTKKDFDNIIAENQEYEALVEKYNLVNDVYTEDYEYILKVYHKCQEENSFLKDNDSE